MEYINVYACSKKHNLTMAGALKEPRDVVPAQWNIRAMLTKNAAALQVPSRRDELTSSVSTLHFNPLT